MTHLPSRKATAPRAKVKAKAPAKGGARAATTLLARIKGRAIFEREMFAAAFGMKEGREFGAASAVAIKIALKASDVGVVMLNGRGNALDVHCTNETLQNLILEATTGPLADCLASGRVGYGPRGPEQQKSPFDSSLAAVGIKSYCCVPVAGPSGRVIAAAIVCFSRAIKLKSVAEQFATDLSVPLSASIFSRRNEISGVAPNQFSSLAKTIPGVVYQRIVNLNGDIRYTFLSEGAREMFGVEPQDVIKDPDVLFRTYSEDYRQTFRARLVEASRTLTKWDVEAAVDLPDGRKRTTHAIARPEPLNDGSVLWTGVILDASRAKEAEESLKAANRLVGLANHAKSAFLAKMSHEMRTPLNGVMGMGDLLLKTDLSPRQTRLATTLCESAKSLLGIINDVLDLSRIEAGHFKLDPHEFNLRHCVEDALELCAMSGYRKGLEVSLIVAPGTPIGVKSDPVRLRQVLINLVGNAIKFTESGEVTVRIIPVDHPDGSVAVAFEVCDTGIGVDKDAIQRLFEPFAQADSSISRRFGGTGLGLSITRHLVELLGGTVEMQSEKGQGTTVRFVLPFEVTAPAQTATILNEASLHGVRALVVDDRPTTREMLLANLQGSGATAACGASETEALSMLADAADAGAPFHVVILDRVRPRMSGLHLCRTIRSTPKFSATSIVALMSANWNATAMDQQGLGNTVLLSKPARRTDLLAAVMRTQNSDVANLAQAQGLHNSPKSLGSQAPSLKLRVLLVEDNLTNIEVAREYLSEFDCRVTVAMNGIEAILAYDRSNFDIILMDSQMPELDGLSATRRIRESESLRGLKRVPIIAVTANAYESDRTQALDAGSDDFLSKPFTDTQLCGMLQKWGRAEQVTEASAGLEQLHDTTLSQTQASEPTAIAEAQSAPLDVALHTVLMTSRPAFLGRLIRAYLSSVPETLAALRSAVAHSDTELLRNVAHSLKSSSANVGAIRLSERCRVLEMKLRLGAEAADCDTLAAGVAAELAQAEKALERLLSRMSNGDNSAAARA